MTISVFANVFSFYFHERPSDHQVLNEEMTVKLKTMQNVTLLLTDNSWENVSVLTTRQNPENFFFVLNLNYWFFFIVSCHNHAKSILFIFCPYSKAIWFFTAPWRPMCRTTDVWTSDMKLVLWRHQAAKTQNCTLQHQVQHHVLVLS